MNFPALRDGYPKQEHSVYGCSVTGVMIYVTKYCAISTKCAQDRLEFIFKAFYQNVL